MPFVLDENPLDKLEAPLLMEVRQALRKNEMTLLGQVVYFDDLMISYKPQYTCIRIGKEHYFFGELTAEGIGVSYSHPSILNNLDKAIGAWKSRFKVPFVTADKLNLQSWLDFVLFKAPLLKQQVEQQE